MIVVTGSPRTGTSLAMQTIERLGVPIVGDRYLEEYGPEELYHYGHWDLPSKETANGINHSQYIDNAVKLFPPQLSKTDSSLIDKLIICKRNKESVLKSIKHSLTVTDGGCSDSIPNMIYYACYRMIESFTEKWNKIETFILNYDEMLKNPIAEINKLKMFLGTDTDINNAVLNVRS